MAQKDDRNNISKCASTDQKYNCYERAHKFVTAAFGAANEKAQRVESALRAFTRSCRMCMQPGFWDLDPNSPGCQRASKFRKARSTGSPALPGGSLGAAPLICQKFLCMTREETQMEKNL